MRRTAAAYGVATVIEVMKLLRTTWMTRPQITAALGVHHETVGRYVHEMAANGLLREAKAEPVKQPRGGRPPKVYALEPEWGGQAAARAGQGEGNGNG